MRTIICLSVIALVAGCASAPQREAPAPVAKMDGKKTIRCDAPDFGVFSLLPPVKIASLVTQKNCKSEAMEHGYDVIEGSE